MIDSLRLSDNLVLLAHETTALVRTAAGLDDGSLRAATLCEGWTRAHVLSHLARNADALGNLVSWAVTGKPVAMYESAQARAADIEAGSIRSAEAIFADLQESAARFATAATGLAGPAAHSEVEMRAGRTVLGGQLPTLRLMEVVFHHVDLGAGFTFDDADPGFVRRAIANAVRRMTTGGQHPGLSLQGDKGDLWSMGNGAQEVTGTNAALLLWLARGDAGGLQSENALPALPAWG
jgi:maleylpyruvate isomerase